MTIKFYLDWHEYYRAQEFFRRSRQHISTEKVIGGVLLTLSALWLFLEDLNLLAVIGLAIGLVIVFCLPLFRRWTSKRKWQREPLYQTEHAVSFYEEGIHFLMGRVESKLDWQYYQQVLESPEGFLLIYGNNSFNLFPKRAFTSKEMIDKFRALANSKLSKRALFQ